MRTGISITLSAADRKRLEALIRDRNTVHKHVWRAEIVLLSADDERDHAPNRHVQDLRLALAARFMEEGIDGLLREKTRPSRVPPLGADVAERIVALTLQDPPGETTRRRTGSAR